jgi:predicted CXXCH cytochrome family protein
MRRLALASIAAAAVPVLASSFPAGAPPRAAAGTCELSRVDRRATASARCLACHDGASAAVADVGFGGPVARDAHPVEVDYERARLAGARLVPAGELPAAVPLVAGKVTCTSCHAAESAQQDRAALPLAGSALCVACHAL